jgi:hypothetical protein
MTKLLLASELTEARKFSATIDFDPVRQDRKPCDRRHRLYPILGL